MKRNAVLLVAFSVVAALASARAQEGEDRKADHRRDERKEEVRPDHRPVNPGRHEVDRRHVVVRERPPALRREIRGIAPSPRHIWIAGNWTWSGRWVWTPGRWMLPPRERAPWVAGHWVVVQGGWSWVEGKWGK